MSYYRAGGAGYYMAGGLFKRLRRFASGAARGIGHLVGQTIKANESVAARLLSGGKTGDIKQAAILATERAAAVSGMGGTVGRVAQMLGQSPPAGVPAEGTPRHAVAAQLASYQGAPHRLARRVLAAHGHRPARRRYHKRRF